MRRMMRGFSLLELIIVLAIMSVIAGVTMPVVAAKITRDKVDETRKEMLTLVPSVQGFWWDCRRYPATLTQLQANSPAVSGWKGPYVTALMSGRPGVNLSLDQDAWNQAYVLTSGDSTTTYNPTQSGLNSITIRSKGPDLTASTADDITQVVNVVFLRRKETIDELNIVNTAIQAYNAQYLATSPLPTNIEQLFTRLYNTNLLPRPASGTSDPLRTDGWGNAYVASPSGVTPVVRVTSTNISNGTPPSGG